MQKALTPVRTARQGTAYHMTGSSVKVSISNTTHLNGILQYMCIYAIQPDRTNASGVRGSCLPSLIWLYR